MFPLDLCGQRDDRAARSGVNAQGHEPSPPVAVRGQQPGRTPADPACHGPPPHARTRAVSPERMKRQRPRTTRRPNDSVPPQGLHPTSAPQATTTRPAPQGS